MHLKRRILAGSITGGAVGLLLGLLAFFCAGGGHGTVIPLAVSASPLTLLPYVGILGTPVLWAGFTVLATAPPTRRNKLRFIGVMSSHYLVAAALVCWIPWDDWARTRDVVPGLLHGWVVSYGAANVLVWWLFSGNGNAGGRSNSTDMPAARNRVHD